MNFEDGIILFFSILGAFNGFILSLYLAFTAKKKKFSNYFLAFLLLALSIRIIKSVFFYFNPQLSGIFIQIGLSACILIGPFLYLYFKYFTIIKKREWIIHILPFFLVISVLGATYPYVEHRAIWGRWIVKAIYVQWLVYIIMSLKFITPVFKKLFQKNEKLSSIELWWLSIFSGVTVIWLAYIVGSYTSYIVGALSFSFVLYLITLLLILKKNKNTLFFEETEKYRNKEIDLKTAKKIETKLVVVKEKELYLNPSLTLSDVAKELNVSRHTLSQFLNDNLNKSFSSFINEQRIEKAKELLLLNSSYTIETLGYDSGFNSKSTFNTAFNKITGLTPSEYRAVLLITLVQGYAQNTLGWKQSLKEIKQIIQIN